jgi:hypothetical protein
MVIKVNNCLLEVNVLYLTREVLLKCFLFFILLEKVDHDGERKFLFG